jgi:hypothetical protein
MGFSTTSISIIPFIIASRFRVILSTRVIRFDVAAGSANGNVTALSYTSAWHNGEPNNSGTENYAETRSDDKWNDANGSGAKTHIMEST